MKKIFMALAISLSLTGVSFTASAMAPGAPADEIDLPETDLTCKEILVRLREALETGREVHAPKRVIKRIVEQCTDRKFGGDDGNGDDRNQD